LVAVLIAASVAAGIGTICDVASALDAAPVPDGTAPPPVKAAAAAQPSGNSAQPAAPAAAAATEPSGSSAQPTAPAAAGNVAGPGGAAEDIRDIRGPKFIWPVWLVPALLAGAVLLAWLGRAAWRRRHRRPRARMLLPFEVALQRLENLRAMMQPERAREFSTEVSGIIRDYIEQRFDVTATHQTTEEFLHGLLASSNAALAKHRTLLSAFLHQCDLVKFAGMALTLHSMESLHASARSFVLETAKPGASRATVASAAAVAPPATVAPAATATPTVPEIRAGAHAPAPRASAAKEAHDSLPSA